mgnify:CR=1 FL=1
MQHMDEGLLQAWLDGPRAGLTDPERAAVGAHLDQCTLCRERVESLRATGERAVHLLAAAEEGDEDIPDFAGVIQRSQELKGGAAAEARPASTAPVPAEADSRIGPEPGSVSSPQATPPARPWWGRRSAWAASIMLALGAGWLANEWNSTLPDVRLDPLRVTDSPASAEPAPAAAGAGASPEGAALESPAVDGLDALELANRTEVGEGAAPVTQERPSALADADAAPAGPPSATSGAGAEAAVAAAERRAAEAPQLREAEAQAARLAPPPVEPDPVVRVDATPAPEKTSVSGRVVDQATGRPLEAVQVFVAGTNRGTLTNADGRFTLFPEPTSDSIARLRVETIGYGQEEFTVDLTGEEVAVGDVLLAQTALALDQLVVTGISGSEDAPEVERFARTVPMELGDDRWRPASILEARAHLGASPGTVPDLPVVTVHIGTFNSLPVVRVEQALEDGDLLTLVQAPVPVDTDDGQRGATTELPGGVFVRGWADIPSDSLRALMERVRAN